MTKSVSNQWIAALQRCEEQQEPYAIVTVIEVESPSSATLGDKAVVTSDGMIHGWIGGGCTQPVIQKAVADAMKSGEQMTVRIQPSTGETKTLDRVRDVHMACHSGGSVHLLVEPFKPTESIAVVGKLRSLSSYQRSGLNSVYRLTCMRPVMSWLKHMNTAS